MNAINLLRALAAWIANVPQVIKAWRSQETGDLSLLTVSPLAAGLALWVAYGFMQSDLVIILASSLAFARATTLAGLKIRHG